MSKLKGHFELTNAALAEIKNGCGGNALAAGILATSEGRRSGLGEVDHAIGGSIFLALPLDTPSPSHGAVLRDLRDVFTRGHWTDEGQKHHFMRRLVDSQSSRAAYDTAVEWIRSEASLAALALGSNLARATGARSPLGPSDGACALPSAGTRGSRVNVFAGAASDHLGNAVHALQDSFSFSHVEREGLSADEPGAIAKIDVYEGHEKDSHGDHDHGWDAEDGFSVAGRQAIAATKALMVLVIDQAARAQTTARPWERFRERWLRVSPRLATQHEDLIDRFIARFIVVRTVTTRSGESRIKTLDHRRLAAALVLEYPGNAEGVYQIVRRVGDHWEHATDELAECYVTAVRAKGPEAIAAMRAHPMLMKELDRALDEGPTFGDQQRALDFLRGRE